MKKSNKGVQGDWIKIEPEVEESFVPTTSLVLKSKVLGAGPLSNCKKGDMVILRDWLVERITINEKTTYYAPEEAVLEIL